MTLIPSNKTVGFLIFFDQVCLTGLDVAEEVCQICPVRGFWSMFGVVVLWKSMEIIGNPTWLKIFKMNIEGKPKKPATAWSQVSSTTLAMKSWRFGHVPVDWFVSMATKWSGTQQPRAACGACELNWSVDSRMRKVDCLRVEIAWPLAWLLRTEPDCFKFFSWPSGDQRGFRKI